MLCQYAQLVQVCLLLQASELLCLLITEPLSGRLCFACQHVQKRSAE